MQITKDIRYIGVNDRTIDLFEGQYRVPNGMAYNSYLILDEKIAVMDTVDIHFTHEWLDNLSHALDGRTPDYLIVQHMEPDHSANIMQFLSVYPTARIVSSAAAFRMMKQFFGKDLSEGGIVITDGDTLSLGKHSLVFASAPMVHWPEVMVTYDATDRVLFSADAFGKFGTTDADEDWACEARRYYFGIVGKYGAPAQALLKKASALDISIICPLHGPVLTENLSYYINLYDTWSSYTPEDDGVLIAYTSVYGNTKRAVELLAQKLRDMGCPKVVLTDLAREDMAEAVEDAFRYSKLVLATTTYCNGIFPFMREFIHHLTERDYQSRTVGLIENGTWAPNAAKTMQKMLEGAKDITFAAEPVRILSALNEDSMKQLDALAEALGGEYRSEESGESRNDPAALFSIGYGLYVVTTNDGQKDNGLIVNTVTQVTDSPKRVAVTINKQNYSFHTIRKTGLLNVNCLSTEAPFKVFETFGFQSGRSVNKFENCNPKRSRNGLVVLPKHINAFLSLKVAEYVDLGTHGMFICDVTESRVLSSTPTMTYTYYQENVKPKPEVPKSKGRVASGIL